MGMTLLAAGTSIPDTVASVMVAREGKEPVLTHPNISWTVHTWSSVCLSQVRLTWPCPTSWAPTSSTCCVSVCRGSSRRCLWTLDLQWKSTALVWSSCPVRCCSPSSSSSWLFTLTDGSWTGNWAWCLWCATSSSPRCLSCMSSGSSGTTQSEPAVTNVLLESRSVKRLIWGWKSCFAVHGQKYKVVRFF